MSKRLAIPFSKLLHYDDAALGAITGFCRDYHPDTVVFAYHLLKIRNCKIGDQEEKNMRKYLSESGVDNIEDFILEDAKDAGFTTSEEFIKSKLGAIKEEKKSQEILTEDKFDKNIIPTTKAFGILGSIITGGIAVFYGNIVGGVITGLIGIAATMGLCILLEGFSTVIKLLRKISEK